MTDAPDGAPASNLAKAVRYMVAPLLRVLREISPEPVDIMVSRADGIPDNAWEKVGTAPDARVARLHVHARATAAYDDSNEAHLSFQIPINSVVHDVCIPWDAIVAVVTPVATLVLAGASGVRAKTMIQIGPAEDAPAPAPAAAAAPARPALKLVP